MPQLETSLGRIATVPKANHKMKRRLGRFGGSYIRFVHRTSTVVSNSKELEALAAAHHPCIFAFWHGQFLLIPAFSPPEVPVAIMVARHGDAELVGEALKTFDMELIRGSGAAGRKKDRGGATALRAALRGLEEGKCISMTADVPPGPARRVGPGIIRLAQLSGRPILPVATASSRFKALNTWSKMTINLPFSRIGMQLGKPLFVAQDANDIEMEEARLELERRLNETTSQVYNLVGGDELKAAPASALAVESPVPNANFGLKLYRVLTGISAPAAPLILRHRQRRGKEDQHRLSERFGVSNIARPEGHLAWFHAASVGETNAILPLFNALRLRSPNARFLLTTGTVTSAKLAAERLDERDIHQFAPLDVPQHMRRFLEYWRPDLAVLTESEIWPNLIIDAYNRDIPMAIVNGRMSDRSYRRWRKNKGMAFPLFSRLRLVLAQNAMLARRFRELGARDVRNVGNLKVDAPKLPVDDYNQQVLRSAIGTRPVWMAASTHPGEDEVVIEAHKQIAEHIPDLLTIIAPRHPERGPNVSAVARQQGLTASLRSDGAIPENVEVYIADTIGELGTLYSIVPTAFIGGSITSKGGQNPIEAIRFGTNVITGPDQSNFLDAYSALLNNKGALQVSSADELALAVHDLMTDPELKQRLSKGALAALVALSGALDQTVEALLPFIPLSDQDVARAS